MSSELFESREDDLRQICENVRRKLTEQIPKCTEGKPYWWMWAWRNSVFD